MPRKHNGRERETHRTVTLGKDHDKVVLDGLVDLELDVRHVDGRL